MCITLRDNGTSLLAMTCQSEKGPRENFKTRGTITLGISANCINLGEFGHHSSLDGGSYDAVMQSFRNTISGRLAFQSSSKTPVSLVQRGRHMLAKCGAFFVALLPCGQ